MTTSTLTPLALTALAFVGERPMHPYEMYQLARQRKDDRLVKLRPGTLYHAIGRLVTDGFVRALPAEREGNRPERTRYEITEAGRAVLRADIASLLGRFTLEYPVFPFALSEAHNLPSEEVVVHLERRLSAVREVVADLVESIERLTAAELPWAYWAHVEYLHTIHCAEAEWLERTISAVSGGAFDLPEGFASSQIAQTP